MAETEQTTAMTPAIAYEYVWFGGQPVAQFDAATNTPHWTFTDHLGTPILQTNASGAVDWRAEYEPYGTVNTLRAGAAKHQPLRFPGQEYDEASADREYNIFRWYRDGRGRYTQGDPIGLSGGANEYGYTSGNPIGYTDPAGLARRCVWAVGSQYVGAGVIVHHLPGQSRNRDWFNLTYFTASCDGCQTPANVSVDASTYTSTRGDLNIIQQALIPDISRLAPQVEFIDPHGPCSQTVTYGVSSRSSAGLGYPLLSSAINQMLYTTLKLCYDCIRCQ